MPHISSFFCMIPPEEKKKQTMEKKHRESRGRERHGEKVGMGEPHTSRSPRGSCVPIGQLPDKLMTQDPTTTPEDLYNWVRDSC